VVERFTGSDQAPDGVGPALERLREQLNFFVFFHLGADAEVSLKADEGNLRIAIAHDRIRPMSLELSWERACELAEAPEAFEMYMLEQLTSHRRHGG
jgi:hypothetical protein